MTAADTDISPRGLDAHGLEMVEYLIRAGYAPFVASGEAGYAWMILREGWLADAGVMGTPEGAWAEIADWAEDRVMVPALAGEVIAAVTARLGHGREAFAAAYAGVATSAAFTHETGD